MKMTQNDLLVINAQKDLKIAQMEQILEQQLAKIQELEKEKSDRETESDREADNKAQKDVQ